MPLSNLTIFLGCLPFVLGLVWLRRLNRQSSTTGQQFVVPIGAIAAFIVLFLAFGVPFWFKLSTDSQNSIDSPPVALAEASNFLRTPMGLFLFGLCLWYWIKTCRRISSRNHEADLQAQNALKPPIPEP